MFRLSFAALILSASASVVSAQQWADKLFQEKGHDFGSVPRAAKVEYQFTVTNPFNEDLHIASVRSSCGCTLPRIEKETVKPHDQGAIIAQFNTRAFTGQRHAKVTVTFDRPKYAEVQLDISGYIRTDVVLNPTLVNLGTVPEGQTVDKTIRIEYAGRNDWKITGVTANSPYLTTSVKETNRGGGRVSYDLEVQLKDGAPAGYLNDQIFVTTNDRRATQFPVAVEGRIEAELTVSPMPLLLGTLQPGQKITKQIVVKGAEPFKIVGIHCDDEGFRFEPSPESKAVHLVPVTFTAGSDTGKINRRIQITTDRGSKTVELPVVAQIANPLAGR